MMRTTIAAIASAPRTHLFPIAPSRDLETVQRRTFGSLTATAEATIETRDALSTRFKVGAHDSADAGRGANEKFGTDSPGKSMQQAGYARLLSAIHFYSQPRIGPNRKRLGKKRDWGKKRVGKKRDRGSTG
jgi:hypothetical protein